MADQSNPNSHHAGNPRKRRQSANRGAWQLPPRVHFMP